MTTIGYMLNTYDEYGPENIFVFGPDADLPAALTGYFKAFGWVTDFSSSYELASLEAWLSNDDRAKNVAHNLSDVWGGIQITELVVA